jgi:LytR cell envelope-related transcriptional attenuator
MDLIDKIGPALGIAAFFGLSVLAFLLFQQSREVRRLREWAGRAPERAKDAADASLAAAEARGEAKADDEAGKGRIAALRERIGNAVRPRLQAVDRRLPIDGRYVAAVLLVAIVAAGVLTSGFGLVGGSDSGKGAGKEGHQPKPHIAVLNATQSPSAPPVAGLAHTVSIDVVKPAGYKVVAEDDAPAGLANTTIMYAGDLKDAADKFAQKVRPKLGDISVQKMSSDVKSNAKGARVALLIGLDDSTFGQ